jgi:hypothetical protein
MKKLIALLSFIALSASVLAQDSPIVVTSSDLRDGTAYLTLMDGWVFRSGNDKDWARTDLNTKDWQKLKPKDLSVKYADKDGRVEGRFRAKGKGTGLGLYLSYDIIKVHGGELSFQTEAGTGTTFIISFADNQPTA